MYTFDSRIRYSETDQEGNLTLEGLLNYFQDCSTFHSEDAGVGMRYLKEEKLVWVLSSWQIEAVRYPEIGEKVTIGTFPYAFKGYFGYRNFVMLDEAGENIAYANSLWTLLNIEEMIPSKMTKLMKERYILEEKLEMNYAARKISIPEKIEEREEIPVKKYHLDTNNHVNNGQYVRMALEFIPEEAKVVQMRAEYKKQARLGDILVPKVAQAERSCVVSLQDGSGSIYVNIEFQYSFT